MENNVLNHTTDEIFSSGFITVEIPLTGKNMPTEFKNFIFECMANTVERNLSTEILNEMLDNGSANTVISKGEISLILKITSDGNFTDDLILQYTYPDKFKSRVCRKFMTYDIPIDYNTLYRKKALRILDKRVKKGLKKFTPHKKETYVLTW